MYNEDIKWIVKSIQQIMYQNGYSNIVVNRVLKTANLERKEQNTHRQIVYGVIENWLYLEHLLSLYVNKRMKRDLKCFLMAGLYELLFLDGRPNHVVLNRYVDTAKVDYKYAHKFVNAVMRRALREPYDLTSLNRLDYLSLKYSQPKWLVERWLKQFGDDETEQLLSQNQKKRSIFLRVNRNLATAETLIDALDKQGVVANKVKGLPYAVEVVAFSEVALASLDAFKAGWFTVQDAGAMRVAEAADISGDMQVLDLCSAPGGKATDMAERLTEGHVLACDIHEHKIRLIEQNIKRLRLNNISTRISNAKVLNPDFIDKYDRVLLDAPCSGFGVISKKPEIKYRKTLNDIENLIKIQREMLDVAQNYVKIGGNLIYSTCTIDLEENQAQIELFLKQHSHFELLVEESANTSEILSDGFYVAVLKRIR